MVSLRRKRYNLVKQDCDMRLSNKRAIYFSYGKMRYVFTVVKTGWGGRPMVALTVFANGMRARKKVLIFIFHILAFFRVGEYNKISKKRMKKHS